MKYLRDLLDLWRSAREQKRIVQDHEWFEDTLDSWAIRKDLDYPNDQR